MNKTKKEIYDVAVLGGGAAGMMAAIQAARLGASVVIIEVNDSLGKKILATGNGKCNYSNENIDGSCYYGASPDFLKTVFSEFSAEETVAFFRELGIEPCRKAGLLYPRSMQASAVLEVLTREIRRLQVDVFFHSKVSGIRKAIPGFEIKTPDALFVSQRVIVAMGGKASDIKGSNGDGYYYAKNLGHTIIPIMPALVQLHVNDAILTSLSGVRCQATVTIFVDGESKRTETGELQLTQHGISGIVVFQLSRIAAYALSEQKQVRVEIDFLPEKTFAECEDILIARFMQSDMTASARDVLIGLFHDKLANALLIFSDINPDEKARTCSEEKIKALLHSIKAFSVNVVDTHGFKSAQVTAGGVDTAEINPHTMESNIVSGLFFAGEIVDVDGICGGYNLQWAWSSGAISGKNAVKGLL